MKKQIHRLFLIAILINFMACTTTQQLVLNTMEPSPIALSDNIKRIGIIDRSTFVNTTNGENRIDQIVAVEEKWLTENGTEAAITGLFDELLKDKRFETVKILDNVPERLKVIDTDANNIDWPTITKLCDVNNVDAVFTLAFYDTDTKVSVKSTKMQQADMMRILQNVAAKELTLETLIENGWRIYDPKNQTLIDELVFNEQIIAKGTGANTISAYKAMGDRRKTILEKSRNSGSYYGQRLLPFKSAVVRKYFTKGSDKFIIAGEKASADNWQEAAAIWQEETMSPNSKLRSKAYHNLAIAQERSEQLENSLLLANKAYDAQENSLNLDYIESLKKRIENQSLLQEQLKIIEASR